MKEEVQCQEKHRAKELALRENDLELPQQRFEEDKKDREIARGQ